MAAREPDLVTQDPRGPSPVAQRTDSPAQRTDSPAQRTDSPAQRTDSPAQRTDSPAQRTDSPAQRADSTVVHLVPMRRRHLRAVMRIETTVYPHPWSLSLFLSELALRSARAYYVAKVEGIVVGYAGLMLTGDEAHVTNVAVAPAWQRHKIATRLLLTLARTALERDATGLTLEVRVGNVAAQTLYRAFGMSPVGIRRNYYAETNEDAILMTASPIDTPAYAARMAAIEASVSGSTIVELAGGW